MVSAYVSTNSQGSMGAGEEEIKNRSTGQFSLYTGVCKYLRFLWIASPLFLVISVLDDTPTVYTVVTIKCAYHLKSLFHLTRLFFGYPSE